MDVGTSGHLMKSIVDRVATQEMQVVSYSRVLLVAELAPGAQDHLSAFFDSFIDEERERDSHFTGLLLVQQNSMLQLVDGQPEAVVSLVRAIQKHTRGDDDKAKAAGGDSEDTLTLFKSVRILASTEDSPLPLFGRLVTIATSISPGAYGEVPFNAEDPAPACWSVYRRILELSKHAPPLSASDHEFDAFGDSAQSKHVSMLPPDSVAVRLARMNKAASADEYLSIYDRPMAVKTFMESALPPPSF